MTLDTVPPPTSPGKRSPRTKYQKPAERPPFKHMGEIVRRMYGDRTTKDPNARVAVVSLACDRTPPKFLQLLICLGGKESAALDAADLKVLAYTARLDVHVAEALRRVGLHLGPAPTSEDTLGP